MAFFDFTGVNGSDIPGFFTEERGTAEIQGNKLKLSGDEARWAISYPSNITDTQSVEVSNTDDSVNAIWYPTY